MLLRIWKQKSQSEVGTEKKGRGRALLRQKGRGKARKSKTETGTQTHRDTQESAEKTEVHVDSHYTEEQKD